MKYAKIAGVHIDLEQFSKFKKLADLKSKGHQVFDHLPQTEQDAAYDELWAVLNGKETPAPGDNAASAAPSAE